MSQIYDNWERLVAGVLRRELIWQLCHQQSRTPSLTSSISSTFSFTDGFSGTSFDLTNQEHGLLLRSAQSLPFKALAGLDTHNLKSTSRPIHLKGSSSAVLTEQELMKAPSFVLGDELETFRNTYLVNLGKGNTVVVKRLAGGHKELEPNMKIIERIEHENVVALRGYYHLSGDEMLGFYDYFPRGSLHTMLHGKGGGLDWNGRMRIAIGAAKGLLHIHRQDNGHFGHGNIKASNILVNSEDYGCMDINPGRIWLCNYHPPELLNKESPVTQASDVYSFGVVLMEILSGKAPVHRAYVKWALANARDDLALLVYDRGLLTYPVVKQEMRNMLVVALSCLNKEPRERPNMNDVVQMLLSMPT